MADRLLRKVRSLGMVLAGSVLSAAAWCQAAGAPSLQVLPSARLANPASSGAVFSAGMSRDGLRTFVPRAATTEPVSIVGRVQPETAQIGQPGQLYLVIMVAPGQFLMRNTQGAFLPWNGDPAALVPARSLPALAGQETLDVFTGVLGVEGEFQIFLGYSASDRVLHFTPTPLTIQLIVDSDRDGVADASDLFPADPARTMAIAPAFPKVNGVFQLPEYAATRQLQWLLQQFAAGAPTPTADVITARFNANALSTQSVAEIQALIQTVRTTHPGSVLIEPITVTPTLVRGLIGIPGNPGSGRFITLRAKVGTGMIDGLSLSTYFLNAFWTTAENRTLTMTQALDRLAGLMPDTSLLVARIQGEQCIPLRSHNATVARSMGSVFKTWVLGGLGQAINEGVLSAGQPVPLVASEMVRSSVLAAEPVGTVMTLGDLGVAMMGISDNTATDHVHERVGRSRLEAIVRQFGHAQPERLTPFLSVNEQFNLFTAVNATQALAYRDGSESFQRDFLNTVLAPLPPNTGFGNDNYRTMFFTGAWSASPLDVCAAFASLRQFNDRSPGFQVIDRAFSSESATVFLRSRWERVWYKGGSLAAGTGTRVLAHAYMMESDARGAYVVVSMHNDASFTLDLRTQGIESTLTRVLQLVSDGTFD